ncbi:MAG: hypothetical protein JO026_02000 [Patescibacteria group bacterium]|nr:hypothetical protein [Patescibacteria group bacterium]
MDFLFGTFLPPKRSGGQKIEELKGRIAAVEAHAIDATRNKDSRLANQFEMDKNDLQKRLRKLTAPSIGEQFVIAISGQSRLEVEIAVTEENIRHYEARIRESVEGSETYFFYMELLARSQKKKEIILKRMAEVRISASMEPAHTDTETLEYRLQVLDAYAGVHHRALRDSVAEKRKGPSGRPMLPGEVGLHLDELHGALRAAHATDRQIAERRLKNRN